MDRPASSEIAADFEQGTIAVEEPAGQEPPAASPVNTAADEPADEPAETEQAGHMPDAASEDAAGEGGSAGRELIGTHEPVGSMAQPIDVQPLRIDASQVCFYYLPFDSPLFINFTLFLLVFQALSFPRPAPILVSASGFTTMAEIARRLEASSVDCLVADAQPIRARYLEVRTELPADVRDALHRVAYMEYWQMDFTRAQRRLARHAEQQQAALLADNSIKRSEEEVQKTQEMQEQLSNRQDELQAINQEIADLRASLALKEEAAAAMEATIAQLSADVAAQ